MYQGERSEDGRKSAQLDEGESSVVSDDAQEHMLDVAKGANPANNTRVYECGGTRLEKSHGTGVVSKRAGRVWKGLFLQLDGAFRGTEPDVSEKVLPRTRNP